MLTQSTQLGCSCVWALASTQTHKLVQSTPTQKLYKHYDEGEGLCPFELRHEGGHPLVHPRVYVFAQRARRKTVEFFPQSLLYISGDSHIQVGPFPERIVLFQVSGTVFT